MMSERCQRWKETTRDASTRARCGTIDVAIDDGTHTTARTRTPCALVPTSRGEHATLTRDVLDDVERRLTRAFSSKDETDPTASTTTIERMFGCALVGAHFVRKSERGYKRKRKSGDDDEAAREENSTARRSDALERCPPKRRLAIGHYRDATYFGLNTQARTSKSSNALMFETPYGQKTIGAEAYMRAWRGDAHVVAALADEHAGWESEKKSKSSAIVTVGWLDACVEEAGKMGKSGEKTSLWGTVLGGGYERVREECARKVAERDASLDGYVLGGFYAGEDETTREACVETVLRHVPEGKPKYLPGVMTIEDIVGNIERGVDVFDAAWASETAARGRAFCFPISPDAGVDTDAIDSTPCAFSGRDAYSINVWSTAYKTDFVPFLGAKNRCACPACADHTRAYVHHLLQAHEMTADVLLEAHNLYHLAAFFAAARRSIENGSWTAFAEFHRAYARRARDDDR